MSLNKRVVAILGHLSKSKSIYKAPFICYNLHIRGADFF